MIGRGELYLGSRFQYLRTVLLTLCSILFLVLPNNAQTIETISGKVVNSKNEVLLGNAILISPQDSTVITGTSFFEGIFELANLNKKKVLLKLTSLEFEDTYISVEYKGKADISLGDILVSEALNELEEVVVVSKTPLVKQMADGSIEVKVDNTALATSTSAQEILSRSPGILVDENNGVSVFGKGKAVIFINGVRVAIERLSSISPTNIDKIEIIGNPGPRYDAEGNAVINIITKRNLDEGSKGLIKNYYSYSDFAGYDNRTNVDYSFKKGKLSMNGTYGLLVGNDRWLKETTRTRNEFGDFFNSDIVLDWQYEHENFSNYSVGFQYDTSKDSYLSIEFNGAFEQMGGNQLSDNIITNENEEGLYSSVLAIGDRNLKNIVNINYYNKLDSLGTNFFVGSQYAIYNNDFDNDINESSFINEEENSSLINNIGGGDIKIFSAQLDYTKAFKNKDILEIGGKFGYVNNQSFTTFLNIDGNGGPIRDDELSSNFRYDERVPAGYVNFKRSIDDNTSYSLGLRTELTDYTLFTSVDDGTIIEDNYLNIFPNASFNSKLSDLTNIYFTYSSRINRPSYESLNPFVIYQDEFTSIRGNPELQPAKAHALEIGGAYGDWSLKLGYTYTKDRFTRAAFQLENDPRQYVLQSVNFDEEHTFFGTLSRSINLKWWQSTTNLSVNFNNLIDNSGVFEIRDNEPSFYFYSQNSFNIKDWISVYLTGWYLSDLQDGIYLRENQSTINIGFEKAFFEDALKCNLDFNDIFYKIRADGNYKSGATDIIYANKFNTNYVRFSVSYNFGGLKKLSYQNKKVGESENERTQ